MRNRSAVWFIVLVVVAVLAATDVLWGGASGIDGFVITKIRLPRVATAMLAGAALALGGLLMQSIFRNPLADPHIMGVSAGAGLGAAVVVLIGGTSGLAGLAAGLSLSAASFIGAAIASLAIMAVSSKVKSTSTLLIFGIMLGFIINAVVAILQFTSNSESLRMYYNWAAGSFSFAGWGRSAIMATALVAGIVLALADIKGLNLILFGEDYSQYSGGNPRRSRILAMLGCCLLAGSVTAFCGPLGFVGIVAPHIARRLAGLGTARRTVADHRQIIPLAIVLGAGLCVAADLLVQLITKLGAQLPVGSTMALIGIPLILVILLSNGEGKQSGSKLVGENRGRPWPREWVAAAKQMTGWSEAEVFETNCSRAVPHISGNNISIGYDGEVLCDGISFEVRGGDCVMLRGANGSGKSTLLRAIAENNPLAGTIETNTKVVLIPSKIEKVKGFTLKEFISTSFYTESAWNGRISQKMEELIARSIQLMGLTGFEDRDISTLSDGEFQKGTIAAALCKVRDCGIIMLDEPTSFLDPENKVNVYKTLHEVAKELGVAFIYSTHDISSAEPYSTSTLAL